MEIEGTHHFVGSGAYLRSSKEKKQVCFFEGGALRGGRESTSSKSAFESYELLTHFQGSGAYLRSSKKKSKLAFFLGAPSARAARARLREWIASNAWNSSLSRVRSMLKKFHEKGKLAFFGGGEGKPTERSENKEFRCSFRVVQHE